MTFDASRPGGNGRAKHTPHMARGGQTVNGHAALDVSRTARALGGEASGRDAILCPGPGHSAADRSLSVRLDPGAPEGFVVHSHAGDDPMACRDHVRDRLGLAP